MIKKVLLSIYILSYLIISVKAQDSYTNENKKSDSEASISSGELRKQALNIFLDCKQCDHNYIKKVIPYVNYVRNKDEADVHVFVRRQVNGGGGGDYTISFIGHGDFEEINEELKFISPIDETADETRKARSGMIAMGLMQYVAMTPIGRNIKIEFEDKAVPERILNPTVEDDPWKSWVFRLRGNGSMKMDENYNSVNIDGSLSVDRVTPEIKTQFDLESRFSQTTYTNSDYEKLTRNWKFSNLTVWSLNNHWSAGGRAGIRGNFKDNYIYSASLGPAIEYNVFDYEDSFKQQIRIQYGASAIYNDYYDLTMYEKLEELVFNHYLSVSGGVNKQWGNGYLYATYSNYLHDFSFNKLRIGGNINYRIYKGLSVNCRSSVSIVRDQINLRFNPASEEDILMQQVALKSGYNFSLSFGLSYSFGSIYNNVVNTRFGN